MADNYSQIYSFIFYSALLGMALGVVYDLFGILRIACDGSRKGRGRYIGYFICDLLFFILAAPLSAIFIFHVNNGRIRGIALMSSLLGFALYYHTLGRLTRALRRLVLRIIGLLTGFILKRILAPAGRALALMSDLRYTRRVSRRMLRSFKRKGC